MCELDSWTAKHKYKNLLFWSLIVAVLGCNTVTPAKFSCFSRRNWPTFACLTLWVDSQTLRFALRILRVHVLRVLRCLSAWKKKPQITTNVPKWYSARINKLSWEIWSDAVSTWTGIADEVGNKRTERSTRESVWEEHSCMKSKHWAQDWLKQK